MKADALAGAVLRLNSRTLGGHPPPPGSGAAPSGTIPAPGGRLCATFAGRPSPAEVFIAIPAAPPAGMAGAGIAGASWIGPGGTGSTKRPLPGAGPEGSEKTAARLAAQTAGTAKAGYLCCLFCEVWIPNRRESAVPVLWRGLPLGAQPPSTGPGGSNERAALLPPLRAAVF